MNTDFVNQNRKFWSTFSAKDSDKKLLIEEPSVPIITHLNAIFSIILNQAKSLAPVWLYSSNYDIEFLKSYVSTAEFILIQKRPWLTRIRILFIAVRKFMKIYITGDILSFSYDGVKYGDLIYDAYLWREKVGTIRNINLKLLIIIYLCIRRHEDIREILSSDNYEAVLIGHQVGLYSGVMLRTALRYGYKVYLRAGNHQSTFKCFDNLGEIYELPIEASPSDINTIITKLDSEFDKMYESIFNKEVSGKGSYDGMYAFSPANRYYKDRESFTRDFGIDIRKKNIFVMLHALNDYPHGMGDLIFKDYYDWFIETLKFAKKNDKVNWIFKQHPSIKFYPMKDVDFNTLFCDAPKNIVYINEKKQIDTRSLIYCADLIITCLGSAGFELPAMGSIPSLTAGDNFYTNLGFVLEPKTKKQYFEILNDVENIERLTLQQQKRAQAAYMYIYYFSRVKVSACPLLSHEEENDKDCIIWFWKRVSESYGTREEVIKEEIRSYIKEVSKIGFKRLNILQIKYNE